MPATDPVILQLKVEAQQYRQQLQSTTVLLETQLDRQERAIGQLAKRFDQSGGSIEAFFGAIRGAVSGLALTAAAREVLRYAEAYKSIEAQLRLATQAFGSYGQAQQDVERLASATRSGLVETAQLYGNFTRATASLGGTQEQAARATETFSKALKIGGAGAAEAASATLQFSQALASGVLRGDEFNSIAEASPRLLTLLADSLGKPRSELRQLAEQGRLTSDVLFTALTNRKYTAAIDAEFKQLPATFGDAMQQVENAAIKTFGAFDRGGQFSTALATFVADGAAGFGDLADEAQQAGTDIRATFAGLNDVFEPLADAAGSFFSKLSLDSRSVTQQIRDDITGLLRTFDFVSNVTQGIANKFKEIDNSVAGGLNRAIDRAGGGRHFETYRLQPYSDLAGRFSASANASAAISAERERTRKFLASIGLNNGSTIRNPAPPPPDPQPAASASAKPKRRAAGKSDAQREIEKQAKLIDDILADPNRFNDAIENAAARSAARIREILGDDKLGSAVEDANRGIQAEVEARAEAESRAQDYREDNIRSLANLYEDLFQGGTDAVWRNFKDQGLRALALIAAQATIASFSKGGGGLGSLLDNIGSAAGNVFGGGLGGGFGGFGRASGGYVGPGQTVRVNENRPGVELLRMGSQGGTVIPLGQAAAVQARGGGDRHYHISVDARGSVNRDDFAQRLSSSILSQAARMDQSTLAAGRAGLPAATERYQKLGTTG